MSSIPIYPTYYRISAQQQTELSALPKLLHTPSGLALLELQGTINLPQQNVERHMSELLVNPNGTSDETPIGRLVFPDYHPAAQDPSSTAWMKRVYLYVGKHQRLTGEVKKLPKAIAVIRKRQTKNGDRDGISTLSSGEEQVEELEIVEIVKWKILFSQRPEPVGTWNGEM